MNTVLPLSEDKKLFVVYRVEPGCLGPEGSTHIEKFCRFSQETFNKLDSDFITWDIVPRNDKSLPEIQFSLSNKRLNAPQAEKYLALFDKVLSEIESDADDKLEALITDYMNNLKDC